MVFGIGGGLFFLYMPFLKMGGIPLISYRDAPRAILKNICKRLGVRMRYERFRDPDEGMAIRFVYREGDPQAEIARIVEGLMTDSLGPRLYAKLMEQSQKREG